MKTIDERFPEKELQRAGYASIWHGQKSWNGVAILSRVGEPVETRRGLPGDPDDRHSRYLEAAVCGLLIGNLYLPNGNPWPGPKFDYKLAWLDRLYAHARELLDSGLPAMLIGDFNVIPTDQDVYKPERWAKDALFSPQAKAKFAQLVGQGWTDAIRSLHPDERLYTSGPTGGTRSSATPESASITRCSVRRSRRSSSQPASTEPRAAGKKPATTPRCGSSWRCDGAGCRIRTRDLRFTKPLLYQLS